MTTLRDPYRKFAQVAGITFEEYDGVREFMQSPAFEDLGGEGFMYRGWRLAFWFCVAMKDGKAVGLVMCRVVAVRLKSGQTGEIPSIMAIMVEPEYQGYGIARMLHKKAVEWCKAEGATTHIAIEDVQNVSYAKHQGAEPWEDARVMAFPLGDGRLWLLPVGD